MVNQETIVTKSGKPIFLGITPNNLAIAQKNSIVQWTMVQSSTFI
jgi:hypothetical protein